MKYARNKYLMSNRFYADRMEKCILCAIIIITNYQTYIAPFSYTRSKAPYATAFGLQTCKVGLSIILHLFRLNMQLMDVKQNTTTKYILWEKSVFIILSSSEIWRLCFTAFMSPWQTVDTDTSHECARYYLSVTIQHSDTFLVVFP